MAFNFLRPSLIFLQQLEEHMFFKYFVQPWFLKYRLYLPDYSNTGTKELAKRDRSFLYLQLGSVKPSEIENLSKHNHPVLSRGCDFDDAFRQEIN